MNLNSIRAVIVAMALGVFAFASPAFASGQGLPFSFGFQTEDGFGFSIGNNGIGIQFPGMNGNNRANRCWTTHEVVQFVRSSGFQRVAPFAQDRRITVVIGKRHRQDFLVAVDPCRGRIVETARYRNSNWGGGRIGSGWR